ncbi:MAG: 50S ribosomal protein L29 [bacterium]|nr:50S ribosomal protein L29 [bacterium]
MLKVSSLREMTREEIQQKQMDLEEEMFNLNMRRSLKQLDNPLRLREIGREIAQVLTVLNEDKLGIRKLAKEKVTVLAGAAKEKGKKD